MSMSAASEQIMFNEMMRVRKRRKESVINDNMTAESVVSDKHVDANDGNMMQADNREKLKRRLDNQAVYIATVEDDLCRSTMQLVRDRKSIDKLTAERDQLSRDLKAEHALVVQFEYDNEKLKAKRDELTNTVNKLRRRVNGLIDFNEFLSKRNKQLESELNVCKKSLTECHAYCRYLQDKLTEYEKGRTDER